MGGKSAHRKMVPPLPTAILAIVDVLAREATEGGPAQDGVDEEQPADGEPDLRKKTNVGLLRVDDRQLRTPLRTVRSRVLRAANAYCSSLVPDGASWPFSASVFSGSVGLIVDRRTHNRRPR